MMLLVLSLQSRGFQQSVPNVQRVVLFSAPSCAAHSPNPPRTFDSHVLIKQVSMVIHRKHMLLVVKTLPSCLRRSWEGHRCHRTFDINDLTRGSHDIVLSRARDKFLTMMLQELATGFLELDLALGFSDLMFVCVGKWTSTVCCTRINDDPVEVQNPRSKQRSSLDCEIHHPKRGTGQ